MSELLVDALLAAAGYAVGYALGMRWARAAHPRRPVDAAGDRLSERSFERLAARVDADEAKRGRRHG